MKSVQLFPEIQGESGNIQFLSKKEHRDAHGGNYQNPTNGYYDPITRVMTDFGDGPYIHNHRRMLPSKAGLGKVKEWVVNHPDTTRFIAKMAVATLTDAGFKYITGKKRAKAKIVPGSQRGVSTSKSNSVTGSVAKVITSAVDAAETTPRSTPVQHLVKDHIRHRNGKEIHVASYQRGGKE